MNCDPDEAIGALEAAEHEIDKRNERIRELETRLAGYVDEAASMAASLFESGNRRVALEAELAETRAKLARAQGAADGYLERFNVSEAALCDARTLTQRLGVKLGVLEHLAHQACVVWESTRKHSLHDIKECMSALRHALNAGDRVYGMIKTPHDQAVLDASAEIVLDNLIAIASRKGKRMARWARAELARRKAAK